MSIRCKNCSTVLSENDKFCQICGTPVSESVPAFQDDTPPIMPVSQDMIRTKEKMSRGKKAKITLLAIMAVLLIVTGTAAGMYFLGGPYKVCHNIKEQNYDEAEKLYNREVDDNVVEELMVKTMLHGYDADVIEAYEANTIAYSTAVQALEALENIGLGDMNTLIEKISKLSEVKLVLEKGNAYFEQEDYQNALLEYSKIDKNSEEYAAVQEKIDNALSSYKTDILQSAQSYIAAQDYKSALQLLATAVEVIKDDTEITALYNSTQAVYEQDSVKQADKFLAEKRYDEAKNVLTQAIKLLPNSQVLSDKLVKVEAQQPVSLSELIMINSDSWEWNTGAPVDTFENDYSTAKNYVIISNVQAGDSDYPYGEFRLYQKYTTFTGTISPHTTYDADAKGYVQIFADDKLVYTSKILNRKTDAFTFSINVTGVDYIKIVFCESTEYRGHPASFVLSDLMLYP